MPEKLETITLRSEEVQDILTKVPHWMIRYGNLLILALIIMLLALSWFVKYPDIISSEALITTQIPPQKTYAKTTGKLSHILVKDNEVVSKNQPLAIIENTANYDDVFILKSLIDSIHFSSEAFYFPIDSLPILFLGDIDAQYALFENSYIQYQLNKQYQPFSNEATASKYSITELKTRLKNLYHQKAISKTELDFSKKDLNRTTALFNKGIISAQEHENKQLEFARTKRNHENFEASISQLKEAISTANQSAKGAKINKIREETSLLKNVIQSFNQLKKSIKDWENQYVLNSSISGTVAFLNYWSVNQTVTQGDVVFSIIPSHGASVIAKLKAPALNSGKLKIGQKVNIKLENYPETEFGIITGDVSNISLFPNKDGLYLVDVTLPQQLMTSYKKQIEFKQEMIGIAEIITEDLRLIERFFYQLKKIITT